MKRTLIAATIAGIAASAASTAQAGFPTVYGRLNVSLQSYDLESINFPDNPASTTTPKAKLATGGTTATDADQWALESSASRLGIKGDQDINKDTKIIYTLEFGVDADEGNSGSSGTFSQRNIFAGVQNATFGTLVAGKTDSPLKTIQTNSVTQTDFDRFNDLALADIGQYLVGEQRPNNTILYTSPLLLGGLEAKLASIQVEESGVETATAPNDDNSIGSGSSASLTYGKSTWFVGVARDVNVVSVDAVRALGEVTLGSLKLGALYQTAETHKLVDALTPSTYLLPSSNTPISEWDGSTSTNNFEEQKGYVLNAAYKTASPWTLKAQVGRSKTTPVKDSLDDVTARAAAIGADYKLNDYARAYTYYAQIVTEGDATLSADAATDRTGGVGLDVKF